MQAYKTKQGNWQLNFSEGGMQKTLYLGRRFTAGSADRVAKIITEVLDHRNRGDALPVDLLRKIEALPLRVRQSLERFGIAAGSPERTLSQLLLCFYETKKHLKKSTFVKYVEVGKQLTDYFGTNCRLAAVQKIDCECFCSHCLKTLSECTVSRAVRRCRSIFRFAVEAEWLTKNPFEKIFSRVDVNLERQRYVDRSLIRRVMDAAANEQDRLLLALARFGGLRIPSEVRELRFSDFAGDVIRIHRDTKTGAREVPLFGEIREVFERLRVNLGKDAGLIFPTLRGYRHRIELAIRAAGVEVWEKLFVNLRSSCITDLAERGYSENTLDAIFGNSAAVRSLHYVQFRKDREYSRVLLDDERLSKSGELENDLLLRLVGVSGENLEEVLALRDLLVGRFGAGKRAG